MSTPQRKNPAASGVADGAHGLDARASDGAPLHIADPLNSATSTEAGRPVIMIRPGQLHHMATAAETALIAAGAPFYVRGADLVRPVVEVVEGDKGRPTQAARLVSVTTDTLLDYMSRAIEWQRYNVRKRKMERADPPRQVATTLLSRDGEWGFPQLVGIITTQTLRPDGTVLSEAGYDPATRLLLINPPPMAPLDPRPTRKAALQALSLLSDLLAECPFVDEASRAVGLSALITPVVRGAMKVVPLHVMRAPTPGSGKSYVVDIVAAIATGQRCPVIAAGRTEEENEKRLGAALIAGQPIVSIDNLNGELSGDALCQYVERPIVEVRPLGRSELVRIESRATIFATGNNILIAGDLVRRVVLGSLDAKLERPELRVFASNPIEKVFEDRGVYIAAALTIVRAYLGAGCPDARPPLGSFEEWSRLVRSALVWLGTADPVDTMEAARAEDPEIGAMREVFAGWAKAIGPNSPVSAGDIITAAEANPAFKETLTAVAGDGHSVNVRRLGRWLSQRKGRIVADQCVIGSEDAHSKTMRWTLKGVAHA